MAGHCDPKLLFRLQYPNLSILEPPALRFPCPDRRLWTGQSQTHAVLCDRVRQQSRKGSHAGRWVCKQPAGGNPML